MNYISAKTIAKEEKLNRTKADLEDMLSRFGWKWAVLASTMGKVYQKGEPVSTDLVNQIRMTRTQIESGCYSVCDIANELRKIEASLFSNLMKFGPQETDNFLELLSKAIGGKIREEDIDISGAEPILPDCLTLPCVCQE
ncbi:MAG: hypothetical protein ACXADY_12810 [Candidatus Hodarchaeales archaeon]|jgi:hypothetical protein